MFSDQFSQFEADKGAVGRPRGLSPALRKFRQLTEPVPDSRLEQMAVAAQRSTRQHFGRTMRLFAPLYVSNECINVCQYCGFSRTNDDILRVTLKPEQVAAEAEHLAAQGFRHILLVSGEHPKFVSPDYVSRCLERIVTKTPSVGIEIAPMEVEDYQPMVAAGAESLVVYQETYHREVYAEMHTAGPKKDFDWRLDTLERGAAAGFRRLQAGVLLGLADWREEALALAAHVEHLLRTCWRSFISISLPRLRPCAGNFQPLTKVSDRDYLQMILAFRLIFPQIGITLSTRESPHLRDALFPLGVTMISAGSHTEPGGYTGQGADDLHHTVRGRRQELKRVSTFDETGVTRATGQFNIADERSAPEIAQKLRNLGLEPVWKDWDSSLAGSPLAA